MSAFVPQLLARILRDVPARQADNTDTIRFPQFAAQHAPLSSWLKDTAAALFEARGFTYVRGARPDAYAEQLDRILQHREHLEWLFEHLADDDSRRWLVALCAYRVLGERHVRLPRNTAAYRAAADMVRRELTRTRRTAPAPGLGYLDEYDLARLGIPVRLEAHLLTILNTFVLQQYRLHRPPRTIEVESGDVVVDGGGCWGDTALYFANKCGPGGTVLTYEFAPENLQVIARNFATNADLAARVSIVERALWHTSGERLARDGAGPGTHVGAAGGGGVPDVLTDAIDDRVASDSLRSVDFIKMDIEGAELDALRGAEQTLRRFKPKLAISVYHRLEHFWQIPEYLDSLGVGYGFYLDHFTIHSEETVLFAAAD